MTDFNLNIPAQILFGVDVVNRIGSFTKKRGGRVLIVTEAILYEHGTITRVQNFLDQKEIKYITFDEVVPNATSSCIEEAVRLARVSKINTIIGLGGIRALSTAKCVAMVAGSELEVDDFLSGAEPAHTPLPYLEVPTTCRNPFMLTDRFLVTDARTRRAFLGTAQPGITQYIFYDPQLCASLSPKYTATTLLDTLLQAIEGYISKRSNFLSDSFFLKAIELITGLIPRIDSPEERLNFLIQATTAGLLTALGQTMCPPGLGSALTFALNAQQLIPKSWSAAILLPHVLEFYLTAALEKLQNLARLLGEDISEDSLEEAAGRGIQTLRRIIGSLGLPARFGEFELKMDDLITVAENAFAFDLTSHSPRGATTDDMYNLLKTAF